MKPLTETETEITKCDRIALLCAQLACQFRIEEAIAQDKTASCKERQRQLADCCYAQRQIEEKMGKIWLSMSNSLRTICWNRLPTPYQPFVDGF